MSVLVRCLQVDPIVVIMMFWTCDKDQTMQAWFDPSQRCQQDEKYLAQVARGWPKQKGVKAVWEEWFPWENRRSWMDKKDSCNRFQVVWIRLDWIEFDLRSSTVGNGCGIICKLFGWQNPLLCLPPFFPFTTPVRDLIEVTRRKRRLHKKGAWIKFVRMTGLFVIKWTPDPGWVVETGLLCLAICWDKP